VFGGKFMKDKQVYNDTQAKERAIIAAALFGLEHDETQINENPAITEFYANMVPVKAIKGHTIGTYAVSDNVSKDVMSYIIHYRDSSLLFRTAAWDQEIGALFKYHHDDRLGLVIHLTPAGENLFMELDVLDPRIAEDYKADRMVSFDDDTSKKRDILAVGNRTGIAKVVGGERNKADCVSETLYSSESTVPDFHVEASELFGIEEQIVFNKSGKPTNDTLEFVTRKMDRKYSVGQAPRATMPPLERELVYHMLKENEFKGNEL